MGKYYGHNTRLLIIYRSTNRDRRAKPWIGPEGKYIKQSISFKIYNVF